MSRVLQLLHADGITRGNRYKWAAYYDAPEINAIFDTEKNQPITWEELDP